jgi:hypothetical protein
VRCAKCEHVWRAVPVEDELEDDSEFDGAGGSEYDGTGGDPAFSDLDDDADEQQDYEEDPSLAPEPASPDDGQDTGDDEDGGAKTGWFGNFLRRNGKSAGLETRDESPEEEEPEYQEPQYHAPQPAAASAAPPRPSIVAEGVTRPAGEVRSLDDARAAVRDVFASIGEQKQHPPLRPASPDNIANFQGAATAYQDEEQEEAFPFARTAEALHSRQTEWRSEAADESGFASDLHAQEVPASGRDWSEPESIAPDDASQDWGQDWQPKGEKHQPVSEGDLDAQLRAALQAHFPSHSASSGDQAAETGDRFSRDETGDESAVSDTLSAFWNRPSPIRGETPATASQEDDEGDPGDISFDERLFHEIEETQDFADHHTPGRQGGALALAAAWGLFLCVAGGLISGIFAFREIAAGAFPGLASFYHAVGMPVTTQPLIFEGVRYDWAVADFKPVLHIKGAVYNRAQRSVKVPGFVVSIKDNDPALDQEFPATLPIEGDKIAPEERTEFEIELVSPSRSITAVALELRNVH